MFWCEVWSEVWYHLKITMSRPYCANGFWELWRHARRSYFRRFHWIMSHSSSTQVGFPHPSTVPCEHGPKCCCRAVYCPWMDFNNNRRTSPDGCIPIILSLRTGLFYKARGFAWANFVHMRQPTPPPNYWHQLFCFVLLNTGLKLIPLTYG